MTGDDNVDSALYAIHSRLGVIEGKVNLVARAERTQLLEIIEAAVQKDALIGQIYLLLDGVRTQKDLRLALKTYGIESSRSSLSRRLGHMERELGIAEVVEVTNATVHGREPAMEKILNLSANIRKWLANEGETVPNDSPSRQSKLRE